MRELSIISAVLFLLLPMQGVAQQTTETARIVNATESFLSTLDADQRKHVLYAFDDNVLFVKRCGGCHYGKAKATTESPRDSSRIP